MKGKKERKIYRRAHRKNLKIDKENSEKLFKEKHNEEKSNFIANIIGVPDNSFFHLQRTPCNVLAPLINSRNSSSDFHLIRKNTKRNVINLFDSPVGHQDASLLSQNGYDESENGHLNKRKKRKGRKVSKDNPIVKEFIQQCNIDWSEIEDFKLVVENIPKKHNKPSNDKDILSMKECSMIKNCFQNLLHCASSNIPNNEENKKMNLSKHNMIMGKIATPAAQTENRNLNLVSSFQVPNEGDTNLSAGNIVVNKSSSLDFENSSNVRESTFFHILNNCLKCKKGLTTSTPNVTPGKFCCNDGGLYYNCQKTRITDECLMLSFKESSKKLETKSQQLLDTKSSLNSVTSMNDVSNSFISKLRNSTNNSELCGKEPHHSRTDNDLCQKKLQSITSSNSDIHDNSAQCLNNITSDNSYVDFNSDKLNYSKELFSTLSMSKSIMEQKKNSITEIKYVRNCVFEEEMKHKNSLFSSQHANQDEKYNSIHSTLSAIWKDSSNDNSETDDCTSVGSSNASDLDLSVMPNRMVSSVSWHESKNADQDEKNDLVLKLELSAINEARSDDNSETGFCRSVDLLNESDLNLSVVQNQQIYSVVSCKCQCVNQGEKDMALHAGLSAISEARNENNSETSVHISVDSSDASDLELSILQNELHSSMAFCRSQHVNQDEAGEALHSVWSAKCEDSSSYNFETGDCTSVDLSNASDLNLSIMQNQVLSSVASHGKSDGILSDLQKLTCEFKSYCEFVSFTHSVSHCRESDTKEVLGKTDIVSVEASEDISHSETNFIEEHASIIVLTLCNQTTVMPFIDVISPEMMPKMSKIGEGVYAEVFCYQSEHVKHVYKIVPIEGNFIVNNEEQKSYREIMSEMLISLELSTLSLQTDNMAPNFIQVDNIYCACGKYPDHLLQEWDHFAELKDSENDRPDFFPEDQHFIIFEFAYGGVDLESAELKNATEAKSVFQQVAFALAVAEQALEFEHRDLHWGNILIAPTKQKEVNYIFQETCFCLPADGVLVSIIDFTLSYLRRDGCTIFTSLADDPTLFTGEGDYQFDIYRMMKENNGNNWETFNPYSNVLWLDYLLKKLLNEKKFKNYKKHQASKLQLQKWAKSLLTYKSAASFVIDSEFFQSIKQ